MLVLNTEWMYRNIAGIAPGEPGEPGFREITVRLRPGGEVRTADGRFDSLYGPVATHWRHGEGGRFTLTVSIPVNTTARVWVPAAKESDVVQETARFLRVEDGCAVFAAGSGSHRFTTGD
ncbi:hypothetical protein GCM10027091_64510 [Streptomyces daliensis]